MNPYFISTVVATLLGLKRKCPRCGRTQVVPPEMKHRTVLCRHCKTGIPPKT